MHLSQIMHIPAQPTCQKKKDFTPHWVLATGDHLPALFHPSHVNLLTETNISLFLAGSVNGQLKEIFFSLSPHKTTRELLKTDFQHIL